MRCHYLLEIQLLYNLTTFFYNLLRLVLSFSFYLQDGWGDCRLGVGACAEKNKKIKNEFFFNYNMYLCIYGKRL